MFEMLKDMVKNAYSPYYKFKVASAVLMKDGTIFKGVNVETAVGSGVCAERNAIAAAVCAGYKKGDFDKVYVLAEKGEIVSPCYVCRQVLIEFMEMDCEVISFDKFGKERILTVEELCPYPYSGEDLK